MSFKGARSIGDAIEPTLANPPKLTESLHFRDIWQIGRGYRFSRLTTLPRTADHGLEGKGGDRALRESGVLECVYVPMYRLLAIAVFLAAAVLPPRLQGQTRAIQRPSGQVRISAAPRIPVVRPSPSRFVAMSPHPFAGQVLHVGRAAFRHARGSLIFFGNSGLREDESIVEEELPFEERAELP